MYYFKTSPKFKESDGKDSDGGVGYAQLALIASKKAGSAILTYFYREFERLTKNTVLTL